MSERLTSPTGPSGAPAPRTGSALPDLSGRTVAVTGANGFVGARTCALLVRSGAAVRAIVRRPDTAPALDGVDEVIAGLEDEEALASALNGVDVVVHTAAAAGDDRAAARAVNVDGTQTVVGAAIAAGVGRVVHVSTTSVLSASGRIVDETAGFVADGASPYAVTKRDAEQAVAAVDDDHLETVVLRPPAILGWGPSSTWGQRVPVWVRDGELPMELDERDAMGWVHVDDFACACAIAAVHADAAGRTFNVGAGTATWGDYLETVAGWFPDAPSPFTPADDPPTPKVLSSTRIREDLGWDPAVSFDDAMAEIAVHHR